MLCRKADCGFLFTSKVLEEKKKRRFKTDPSSVQAYHDFLQRLEEAGGKAYQVYECPQVLLRLWSESEIQERRKLLGEYGCPVVSIPLLVMAKAKTSSKSSVSAAEQKVQDYVTSILKLPLVEGPSENRPTLDGVPTCFLEVLSQKLHLWREEEIQIFFYQCFKYLRLKEMPEILEKVEYLKNVGFPAEKIRSSLHRLVRMDLDQVKESFGSIANLNQLLSGYSKYHEDRGLVTDTGSVTQRSVRHSQTSDHVTSAVSKARSGKSADQLLTQVEQVKRQLQQKYVTAGRNCKFDMKIYLLLSHGMEPADMLCCPRVITKFGYKKLESGILELEDLGVNKINVVELLSFLEKRRFTGSSYLVFHLLLKLAGVKKTVWIKKNLKNRGLPCFNVAQQQRPAVVTANWNFLHHDLSFDSDSILQCWPLVFHSSEVLWEYWHRLQKGESPSAKDDRGIKVLHRLQYHIEKESNFLWPIVLCDKYTNEAVSG